VPNDPYLDASVRWKIRTGNVGFQEPKYPEVAEAILDAGVATEVLQLIGSGKEADVYACRDGPDLVAVKAYRTYRTSHRGGRPIKLDSMGNLAVYEFDLLVHAFRGGARVPIPLRRVENLLSMTYLGDEEGPAPKLIGTRLDDPERFQRELVQGVIDLADAGVVHTDLSPFNVLVHEGKPWFIDLGQCVRVDRLGASPWIRLTEAAEALQRGLLTFDRYFRRYGLRVDIEETARSIVKRLDRFGVLL
jgi:serine/threonine-protein kinase RIO1